MRNCLIDKSTYIENITDLRNYGPHIKIITDRCNYQLTKIKYSA